MSDEDKKTTDDPGTGLRFTDVLFGFVFAQLFTRLTDWGQIDGITRAHLVMGAVLVLASYIGFRNSLKRGDFPIRFFNLPFFKFVTDQVMVILYFLVATATPEFNDNFVASSPGIARTDVRLLVTIAALYLVWDLLSWLMCRRGYDIRFGWMGVAITALFLAATVGLQGYAELSGDDLTRTNAIALEAIMIFFLILYRFAKDHRAPDTAQGCRQ